MSGLIAIGLAPLLINTRTRSYRAWLLLATIAVIVGGTVTLLQPAYSTQMPQRTLLWYALDADSGKARWILQPDSKRSAPQLAFDGAGETQPASLPVGNISGTSALPAPHLDYLAPQLQIIDAQPQDGGIAYRMHLRSARAAPEIELAFPRNRAVTSVALLTDGKKIPAHLWRAPDGTGWLDLIGAPPEGIDLEVVIPDAGEIATKLLDRSYGLPAAGAALRPAGPSVTTASQDGDLTIVYRAITLAPLQHAPDL